MVVCFCIKNQVEEKEIVKEIEKIRSKRRRKFRESIGSDVKGGKCVKEKEDIDSVK